MQWQCPICRRLTDSETDANSPFCSERCKMLDLGAWASEKYAITEPVIDESTPDNFSQDPHDQEN